MPEWPFDVLIVDESSKFKNTQTLRHRLLRPMLGRFRRRYILTGSPAPNGLMDLFGQILVMDRGATFGPYITRYRREYFDQTGYGGYEWRLKPGADKKIHAAIAPRVLRMSVEDYEKLPKLIVRDLVIEIPPDARRAYDQMENVLRAEIEGVRVSAVNAGVASMKCRQISGGAAYKDDGSCVHVHDAKISAIEDLVEEMEGQPCMIVYEFRHELERLRKIWPSAPSLGGGVSAKRGVEIEREWNAGGIPVQAADRSG
jgi:SNF2 family DNA or RNA helicase